MNLNVFVGDERFQIDVAPEMLEHGAEFFAKMDRDMDRGWQMSREYVEKPNQIERCQIVADKLLTALTNGNKKTALLMAGYILTRLPGVTGVDVDTTGEMQATEMRYD